MLVDRRVNGGKISFAELAKMQAGLWVNATELFCRADGQLAAIVADKVEAS